MARVPFLVKLEPELLERLRAYSGQTGESMAAVLSRGAELAMGRPEETLKRLDAALYPPAAALARSVEIQRTLSCPKCGHGHSVHQGGAQKDRCERCNTCRWTP